MGRPSDYNPLIAERICDELAHGRSLRSICEGDDFPSDRSVYRWLDANEDFRQQYARAREQQADRYAAEIIELADKERICEKRTIKPDGGEEVVILDQTERSRLQIDARKWYAGKLAPKKYGDKMAVTGGDEGDKPVEFTVKVIGK